jgi:PII-like signaling protein
MSLSGEALRLTVVIGESDRVGRTPAYVEIVTRAHAAGLAGASVFRGIEGYGRTNHVHTTRILSLSDDLPVTVVVVDSEERIRGFLPQLEDLVTGGLVIVEPVEVVTYVAHDR